MSPRTPSMVRCSSRRSASSAGASTTRSSPVCSSTMVRQTRCRNRCAPITARVSQGRETSSGPIDISYTRKVSAPYASHISSGVTTFFSDLPILPYSRRTGWPRQVNPPSAVGSTSSAGTYWPRASV
jgi:hypothetical protein